MHPFARHITAVNNADWTHFTPLLINQTPVGMVHRDTEKHLLAGNLLRRDGNALHLVSSTPNFEAHTVALQKILHQLIAAGLVARERFELYNVGPSFSDKPLALADRALMPALGLIAHGIHCNAYVKRGAEIYLWVARRSANSAVDPGKLDHLVAGGQPYNLSLRENLSKEAWEEAAIPRELVANARAAGCLRYARQEKHYLRRDTLFVFDLELPASFQPASNDGESGEFQLLPVSDIHEKLIAEGLFKFNIPLVLVDFFIRHGLIEADEKGYDLLVTGLHAARF